MKTQHLRIIWKIKQYFSCFYCSIFLCAILLSSGIARPIIQAETGVSASALVIWSDQKINQWNIRLTGEIMLCHFSCNELTQFLNKQKK